MSAFSVSGRLRYPLIVEVRAGHHNDRTHNTRPRHDEPGHPLGRPAGCAGHHPCVLGIFDRPVGPGS